MCAERLGYGRVLCSQLMLSRTRQRVASEAGRDGLTVQASAVVWLSCLGVVEESELLADPESVDQSVHLFTG